MTERSPEPSCSTATPWPGPCGRSCGRRPRRFIPRPGCGSCSSERIPRRCRTSRPRRGRRSGGHPAETLRLPADISPERLLAEVARANGDPDVDGILIQLPLPAGHSSATVLDSVDPLKDVDGFHPEKSAASPGPPAFCAMHTRRNSRAPADTRHSDVRPPRRRVGRSDIVGKPIAALLTARDATVTICHSKTRDLAAVCREADILIAAIGRPGFVTRSS